MDGGKWDGTGLILWLEPEMRLALRVGLRIWHGLWLMLVTARSEAGTGAEVRAGAEVGAVLGVWAGAGAGPMLGVYTRDRG